MAERQNHEIKKNKKKNYTWQKTQKFVVTSKRSTNFHMFKTDFSVDMIKKWTLSLTQPYKIDLKCEVCTYLYTINCLISSSCESSNAFPYIETYISNVRLDINGWSNSKLNNRPNKQQILLGYTLIHNSDTILRNEF